MRWFLTASLLVAQVACFGPQLRSDLSCDQSDLCPSGFNCVDGQCERPSTNDPDAAPSFDATPVLSCEDWQPVPTYLNPCGAAFSFESDLILSESADYTIDTDEQTLMLGASLLEAEFASLALDSGVEVVAITARNVELGLGATLRVVGSKPLLIAALGIMTIAGDVDVSSRLGNLGAGSTAGSCMIAGGGTLGGDGSSGGGGGGYGSDGGRGGRAGNDNDGGDGGGVTVDKTIRGGCEGGRGGGPMQRASGGPGGGSVHFMAASQLSVTGSVHAGGGGGQGALDSQLGGGGGGSGGHIGIEAPIITLSATATLAANGGGGGGADGESGAGANATATAEAAAGGGGMQRGGDGAAGSEEAAPGQGIGIFGMGGGAGGGGGGGRIVMFGPPTDSGAIVSPSYEFVEPL